ncbi:hypothetical protein JCM18899A_14220 [Nocardioides sp. AN3]
MRPATLRPSWGECFGLALIPGVLLGLLVWAVNRPGDSDKYPDCNGYMTSASDKCYDHGLDQVTTFGEFKSRT